MKPNGKMSGGPNYYEKLFAARFYENIVTTSSTALGREESKHKPGKPRLGMSGATLEQRVKTNSFQVAAVIIRACNESWPANKTIREIINATHDGFSPKLGKFRTHQTAARYGVLPKDISRRMREFEKTLEMRLDRTDPVWLAAWAEFQFDELIHPLSDGCGRVSKAISAWILVRKGLPLPRYGARKIYLRAVQSGWKQFLDYYRRCCFRPTKEEFGALNYLVPKTQTI